MIILTNNLFLVPFMLVIWALDTWLFLASLRLLLGRVVSVRSDGFYAAVRRITDGLPRWVGGWIERLFEKKPSWVSWATAIFSVVLIRHLLVWLIAAGR